MPHMLAELCPNRPGTRIVAVRRHSVRSDASDRLCRAKESFGCGEIAVFAQHHVERVRWSRKIGQVLKLGSPWLEDGPDDGQAEEVFGGIQGEGRS